MAEHMSMSMLRKGEKYFDAIDGGTLLVYDDGVDVPSEDDRYGSLILALRRLAQVDHPTTHA